MPFNRREFLQQSCGLTAGLAIAAELPIVAEAGAKVAPNDRINVCVMGLRGRGRAHIGAFLGMKETQITALCDVDAGVLDSAARKVQDKQGKKPRTDKDIRKLLEDDNIDVVAIATPNHWHALASIWAIQHGKDVYVEKPVSHNVSEGRRIVEFARKHNKIVQTGTQSRSSGSVQKAIEFIHNGGIGKVYLARALCYKRRGSIGKVDGPQPVPKGIDYNLWCGPAPQKPLMRKRLHYDWHWIWDTGNGDLGNQGIHQMDVARWGLNVPLLAKQVFSVGGRFGYEDDGETPNTQVVFLDYGDKQLIFEVRGLPKKKTPLGKPWPDNKNYIGNIFYGTKGYLVIGEGAPTAYTKEGEVMKRFGGGGENHFANFIKAVQSRKRSDLNADIEEGHLSSALCHLGNISYLLGSHQPFNAKSKSFGDDKETYATLERFEEHLNKNGVKLENNKRYIAGRKLQLDPKYETFINNSKANAMLTRNYRSEFTVPAKVS